MRCGKATADQLALRKEFHGFTTLSQNDGIGVRSLYNMKMFEKDIKIEAVETKAICWRKRLHDYEAK